jgi:hypothetical protein
MDVCERIAHHDPRGHEWRDRFFIECSNSLMDPKAAGKVAGLAWMPALLNCVVVRLNADVPPLLPAREAMAALQILAHLARCSEARAAVKHAVLSLGQRADDLFNDKLAGIRSFSSADTTGLPVEGASGAGVNGRSVVHNSLVVTLMRVETYTLSADALLELVDGDVGAVMSIVLALAKIVTYEMGITANCLAVMDELTHPGTYFNAEASSSQSSRDEVTKFGEFTKKIRVLIGELNRAKALDTILPAIHRRAAKFARDVPSASRKYTAAVGEAVPAGSPVTVAAPSLVEVAQEPVWFARSVNSLCRTVANVVLFSPDLDQTTALRQHILVVQDACKTFAAILTSIAGTIAASTNAGSRSAAEGALCAALEMFCLASRDVARVADILQVALLVALRTSLEQPRVASARLVTTATVAMVNAGLLAAANSGDIDESIAPLSGPELPHAPDLFDTAVEVTQLLTRAMLVGGTTLDPWLTAVSGHPNVHHQRAATGLARLLKSEASDLDRQMAALDDETRQLEADLAELQTARAAPTTAAAADDAGARAPSKLAAAPAGTPPASAASSSSAAAPPSNNTVHGSLLGALPSLPGIHGRSGLTASPTKALDFTDATTQDGALHAKRTSSAPLGPTSLNGMEIPAEFKCALRGTLMMEPIKLPSGRHVDRNTLRDVIFSVGHVDPITAKPLPSDFNADDVDKELRMRIAQFQFNVALISGARSI